MSFIVIRNKTKCLFIYLCTHFNCIAPLSNEFTKKLSNLLTPPLYANDIHLWNETVSQTHWITIDIIVDKTKHLTFPHSCIISSLSPRRRQSAQQRPQRKHIFIVCDLAKLLPIPPLFVYAHQNPHWILYNFFCVCVCVVSSVAREMGCRRLQQLQFYTIIPCTQNSSSLKLCSTLSMCPPNALYAIFLWIVCKYAFIELPSRVYTFEYTVTHSQIESNSLM